MKIDQNKVVVLTYEVEVEGKVFDKATEEKPLDYIQGNHMIIPRLEAELEGKEEGETFECVVTPEEGYGEYDLSRVIDLPKSSFVLGGELREDLLEVGRLIPMLNSAGEVCNGTVVAVGDETVTMDFNLPLAGKTMHFTGKVLSVREATEKELLEGLHGEFLPPTGGCHCHGGCHGHHGEGEGCCHGEGEECRHGEGEGCCHGHCHEE